MLTLAGINACGAAAFGLAYLLAGARLLPRSGFWAALGVLLVACTVLWVRAERRQGPSRDVLSRLGRVVAGVVLPIIAAPTVVLMPLFFVQERLPREAGMGDIIGRVMFLLLASLALMILVNVAGVTFLTCQAIVRWWRMRSRPAG